MSAREALMEALTRLDLRIALTGPAKGLILADSMADALIQALAEEAYQIVVID